MEALNGACELFVFILSFNLHAVTVHIVGYPVIFHHMAQHILIK